MKLNVLREKVGVEKKESLSQKVYHNRPVLQLVCFWKLNHLEIKTKLTYLQLTLTKSCFFFNLSSNTMVYLYREKRFKFFQSYADQDNAH